MTRPQKSTSSKSNKNSSNGTSAVAATTPVTPPGDMPPTRGAPSTPKGWKAPTVKGRGKATGLRPKQAQVINAIAAANELATSPTYVEDFGSRVPAATTLSFLVTNASSWRDTWEKARAYAQYAADQRAAWEDAALGQMDTLKPSFEFVATRDPTVAEKYSATAKFLGATNAIAQRAAASRKANAKGTGKNGTSASTPAPAATSGANGSEPVTATK